MSLEFIRHSDNLDNLFGDGNWDYDPKTNDIKTSLLYGDLIDLFSFFAHYDDEIDEDSDVTLTFLLSNNANNIRCIFTFDNDEGNDGDIDIVVTTNKNGNGNENAKNIYDALIYFRDHPKNFE